MSLWTMRKPRHHPVQNLTISATHEPGQLRAEGTLDFSASFLAAFASRCLRRRYRTYTVRQQG
ncbi:MAG: hypothetical protein LAT55_12045 [Opitutales bacterium]|nr:hypothetical protein [Opitutales bacterium]